MTSVCLITSSQVQCLQIEHEAMEISSHQDLKRKMAGLRNEVQVQIVLIYVVMFYYAHVKGQYMSAHPLFLLCTFGPIVHGTCNYMPGGAAR